MKELSVKRIEQLEGGIRAAMAIIESVQGEIASHYDLQPDAVDFCDDESPAAELYNALEEAVGSCEFFVENSMNL